MDETAAMLADVGPVINRVIRIDAISPHPQNYNDHPEAQVRDLMASDARFNQVRSIVVQQGAPEHYLMVAGHGYTMARKERGRIYVKADVIPADWTPEQVIGYLVADNLLTRKGVVNEDTLATLLRGQQDAGVDLASLGVDETFLTDLFASVATVPALDDPLAPDTPSLTLADRFLVPPFSVLDARQGYWQDRKRQWLAMGIKSEIGRGEHGFAMADDESGYHSTDQGLTIKGGHPGVVEPGLNYYRNQQHKGKMDAQRVAVGHGGLSDQLVSRVDTTSFKAQSRLTALQKTGNSKAVAFGTAGNISEQSGTSIFDPVLCELIYRWFSPVAGIVLDPFAGGSVRGIVAGKVGRRYIGIDLRAEQVAANEDQAATIIQDAPLSNTGDTVQVRISAKSARLLFHGCDPAYIASTCKARCCESSTSPTGTMITINPYEADRIVARGGKIISGLLQPNARTHKCSFKTGDDLCSLHFTPDKPFGCIASPFTLAPGGKTLVVRNRYKLLICYKDGDHPQPAYIAFRASLDLIFGGDEAQRICDHLTSGGGDILATMPRKHYQILQQNDAIKHGEIVGDGDEVAATPMPQWIVGDSCQMDTLLSADTRVDLVFTCPPYFDLEVYSDDPDDLSTKHDYAAFIALYRQIIAASLARLRADRFAAIVVGDIRDKRGIYRNFVADTIAAFQDAGALLYNEAILVTSIGSLPVRAGRVFTASRKLGKTHQNVLIFVKGDPQRATAACGEVDISFPTDGGEGDEPSGEETAEHSSSALAY